MAPLHGVRQRRGRIRHGPRRRPQPVPIFELLEWDRLIELVDGENLVGVVVALPIHVVHVELAGVEAAAFHERRVVEDESVGGVEVKIVQVRVGVRTGSRGGIYLADVFEAGVWCGHVVPDLAHSGFEGRFAEFVNSIPRDDLLHAELASGNDDVGLSVSDR